MFSHVFLVFLTTFGPHHFWPRPPLGSFFIKPFVPKPLRTILGPKKPWPMELLFGTICCSCLVFWAMDLPARDTPCPRPPCAGSPVVLCGVSLLCCVVLWCVGAVCATFSWVRPKFGRSPPPDPRLPPLRRTPLRRTAQNVALCSLSRSHFRSFSGSLLVEFWWCLKRRCQLCTFGLTGCRVKPWWLGKCQEQFYN